ncbi:MAG: RnfABCDGE type electron transport complex subunit D [Clostridium sp.]
MENRVHNISPAPHIHKGDGVNKIMMDVIIALLPIAGAGIYFYGANAFKILLTAVIVSMVSEMIWNRFVKNGPWITDYSPIVSGLIVGLILPTYVPLWVPAIGAAFATIIVKQFFGGLGQNFMNPAAATKAFLIASWASVMAKPIVETVTTPSQMVDTATSASTAVVEETVSLLDRFIGQASGNIGETSILAILIGGLYLVLRNRINLRAPLTFLIAAYGMSSYLGKDGLLSGAFFLVAVFMTTEYATTPMTKVGQYIFGFGAGIIAALIVVQGYNPEGPYYAIIIMNLTTPVIEYLTTKKYKREVA